MFSKKIEGNIEKLDSRGIIMKALIFYFKNIKMAEQLLDRFNIDRDEADICDISCAGSIRNWANYEKIYISNTFKYFFSTFYSL